MVRLEVIALFAKCHYHSSNTMGPDPAINDDDESSLTSDGTWTPSVDSDDSSFDSASEFAESNGNGWSLNSLKPSSIQIKFNHTDALLAQRYWGEVDSIRTRLTNEVDVQRQFVKKDYVRQPEADLDPSPTANELFNCVFTSSIVYELIATMNHHINHCRQPPLGWEEFGTFMQAVCWFCYYQTSTTQVQNSSNEFVPLLKTIQRLSGKTKTQKFQRLMLLFRSLEGHESVHSESLTWRPVYSIDRGLERFLRSVAERSSDMFVVRGKTDLVIDDDKLDMRSTKVSRISLVRSKGLHSFGPVANCLNSLRTRIVLSSHLTHHNEGATEITRTNLQMIANVNNSNQIKFENTMLYGDRGYNDKGYFELVTSYSMDFLNTVKRGPSLPFKFGTTSYKTSISQIDILENGPMNVWGATRSIGEKTGYIVVFRNGVGRVTILQSTDPSLSFENFDYVTHPSDDSYSEMFIQAESNGGVPSEMLTEKYCTLAGFNLLELTQFQGGVEWILLRRFRLTSTLGWTALRKRKSELTEAQSDLLTADLGLQLVTEAVDDELDATHATKSADDLKRMTNAQLTEICKSYKRPYSNKNKEQLVLEIQKGPLLEEGPKPFEQMLKKMFMAPLADKDRSAHKLGSLNEANVRSFLSTLLRTYGCFFIKLWEFGLICQKEQPWLATSLDGWAVCERTIPTYDSESDSEPSRSTSDAPLTPDSESKSESSKSTSYVPLPSDSESESEPSKSTSSEPSAVAETNNHASAMPPEYGSDSESSKSTSAAPSSANSETSEECVEAVEWKGSRNPDKDHNDSSSSASTTTEKIHIGIEIKTPSSKALLQKLRSYVSMHGHMYFECWFGDHLFQQLVYDPQYRVQVLHHATVCMFSDILFVVADESQVIYAVWIRFKEKKKKIYTGILKDVYEKELAWAYTDAWASATPQSHIPQFESNKVYCPCYKIQEEDVLFHYCIWRKMSMSAMRATIPLPRAKRIVPSIVARWNKGKGPVDEMSRYLSTLHFLVAQLGPKPILILREIKKIALGAFLAKKHCFPTTPVNRTLGFSRIIRKQSRFDGSLNDFFKELAQSYTCFNPMEGMIPASPTSPGTASLDWDEQDSLNMGQNRTTQWQFDACAKCKSIGRNRLSLFSKNDLLVRIRLDKNLNHNPREILIKGVKKRQRCPLCAKMGMGPQLTAYCCATCQVPLCVTAREGKKSCLERFHEKRWFAELMLSRSRRLNFGGKGKENEGTPGQKKKVASRMSSAFKPEKQNTSVRTPNAKKTKAGGTTQSHTKGWTRTANAEPLPTTNKRSKVPAKTLRVTQNSSKSYKRGRQSEPIQQARRSNRKRRKTV